MVFSFSCFSILYYFFWEIFTDKKILSNIWKKSIILLESWSWYWWLRQPSLSWQDINRIAPISSFPSLPWESDFLNLTLWPCLMWWIWHWFRQWFRQWFCNGSVMNFPWNGSFWGWFLVFSLLVQSAERWLNFSIFQTMHWYVLKFLFRIKI